MASSMPPYPLIGRISELLLGLKLHKTVVFVDPEQLDRQRIIPIDIPSTHHGSRSC
jgi:hypothetical protein